MFGIDVLHAINETKEELITIRNLRNVIKPVDAIPTSPPIEAHEGWKRGAFIDKPQYKNWSQKEKYRTMQEEMHLVRPSTFGNAICRAVDPDMAKWISERLNTAARLERLIKDRGIEL